MPTTQPKSVAPTCSPDANPIRALQGFGQSVWLDVSGGEASSRAVNSRG